MENKSCSRYHFHVSSPHSLDFGSLTATFAISYHKEAALFLNALQNKADNIFWDGALYLPRVVSLQQLLQETKPNPPICKLERKSTTQSGIWFRTEWFTHCLRGFLDKSNLPAKHLRGKRKFLHCCLNAVINQNDKRAWPCYPQRNKLCISLFRSTTSFVFTLPSLASVTSLGIQIPVSTAPGIRGG